jgi:hypothetical protein
MPKSPEVYTNEAVDKAMKDAALCPFCGATQGVDPRTRFVRVRVKTAGERWFYVSCWICGAAGADALEPLEAVKNWNQRGHRVWTPLGAHSFLLPGPQKYSHLLVQEGQQQVSFIDYLEEEISVAKDGVQAQTDVDLGKYRVCEVR